MSLPKRNHYNISVLGLDGAGKTKTIMTLKHDPSEPPKAQWGFSVTTIPFQMRKFVHFHCISIPYISKTSLTFYDIGGHTKFRQIWSNYYADAMGCIYVIDASNQERFEETKNELHSMYHHEYMNGKPLLMYCSLTRLLNRPIDSIATWSEKLELYKMIQDKFGFGTKKARVCIRQTTLEMDDHDLLESIISSLGIQWLIKSIEANYKELEKRVTNDIIMQKLKWDQEQRLKQQDLKRKDKAKVFPFNE